METTFSSSLTCLSGASCCFAAHGGLVMAFSIFFTVSGLLFYCYSILGTEVIMPVTSLSCLMEIKKPQHCTESYERPEMDGRLRFTTIGLRGCFPESPDGNLRIFIFFNLMNSRILKTYLYISVYSTYYSF